jgi:hypothetical protein
MEFCFKNIGEKYKHIYHILRRKQLRVELRMKEVCDNEEVYREKRRR